MKRIAFIILLSFVIGHQSYAQTINTTVKNKMLHMVNTIRKSGCKCGNKYMPPVPALTWNNKLYRSARGHAIDMRKNNYFSHNALDGTSFEYRFDAVGYEWMEAGENIAVGQLSIKQVMKDWVKSPSHCRMLMSPRVNEFGMARQGKYWVQHFGKQIPDKSVKRGKIVYLRD